MIIVDTALQKRVEDGRPIRVGLIGAGYMGRGIALQIATAVPGMVVSAIYNRHVEGARRAYAQAGIDKTRFVETTGQLEEAIHQGQYAVTDDALLLCC